MDKLTADTYKRLVGWSPKEGDHIRVIGYPYKNREGILVGVYTGREAQMYGELCVKLSDNQPPFPLSMSIDNVIPI